jgi:outer membrane murein-binding lipoprotein Lpp
VETIALSQLYLLLAALGVGLTLIALVGRGLYVWGRMSRQVDDLNTKVDGLIVEVQQMNRMMAALVNHRHDLDGNVVFNLPAD